MNNNVSDNDSNIDDSKEEELQFSLNIGSDGKANGEDDSNTFMEMAFNEQNFEVVELLDGRLKGYFVSDNVFNNNLTQEEGKALYDLRNNTSMIIKEAERGSVVVIWDKEDYLKDAEEQLSCKEIYEEVTDDPSLIIETMHRTLEKIW